MVSSDTLRPPSEPKTPRALDLGSGPSPAPGYVGVDLFSSFDGETGAPRVLFANLFDGSRWPFEGGSIERMRAWHVIEHIPHERVVVGRTRVKRIVRGPGRPEVTHHETIPLTSDAFFWFFDEAYRVAAPGCRFELAWPHPLSDGADQDPTHCRRVNVQTLHYLSKEGRRTLRVHHYPVACDWLPEPGSVQELGSPESLAPFTRDDGSVDFMAARRSHGAFHEIRAVLVKPFDGETP